MAHIRYIFLLFFIAFTLKSKAKENIDSLKNELQKTESSSVKFDIYYKLVLALAGSETAEARKFYSLAWALSTETGNATLKAKTELLEAIVLYEENNNLKSKALFTKVIPKLQEINLKIELNDAYSYNGVNCMVTGDYAAAIENFEKAVELGTELNKQKQLTENYLHMGRSYQGMGNMTKALENFQKALGTAEALKHDRLITQSNLFIGALYSEGTNDKLGMEYLKKAAAVSEKMKDTAMLINAYTFIANQHYYKKEYKKALEMYEKVALFCPDHGSKNTYAGIIGNMGNVYADMGNIDKAMELQFKAIELFEELGDKQGLTICYNAIGANYMSLKQYDKALEYFNKSLPMAEEMKSLEDLIEIHYNLSRLYEEQKSFEKAYLNYKLFKQYSDSVFNSNNSQKLAEMELKYEFDSKQKEAKLLQELTSERYKRFILIGIGGVFALLIIIVLVGRANRNRKKINEQLTFSNTAMRVQKEELETHKKEITDSINYAKRIQESILPPDAYWKNILPDSFIFYRPKDIVSGDFYWIEQKNDSICFAAVDCTGHGVPGALMSVVGFNLLTQSVNEMNLTVPSDILKHLDYGVTKTLRQSGDGKGVKDGMDLSLCSLNKNTNTLQYAGAFNSLYYIKDGAFHEIKADKFPIGVNLDGKVDNYTNHSIELKKGDCVYLFSDGYADQFGGPRGKKFKYNQLKELLHRIHTLPLEIQKEQLTEAFDSWKGELEQVDDVVIIGVRI